MFLIIYISRVAITDKKRKNVKEMQIVITSQDEKLVITSHHKMKS